MKDYTDEEWKLLTEVLPNVARELRGTMANACAAASKLMPDEGRERNEKTERYAAVFTQSIYRINRIIGNLTDVRMLGGERQLRLFNADIVAIVRDVCERAASLFAAEGVELSFESSKRSQIIRLDETGIERMLFNLLSNALKFTPKGGRVRVRVHTARKQVHISVADTGCGIAPERLEHIFDRFLEPDTMDPPPHGLGLGLALCRGIAQGHGGTILVESEQGKGTTFTVSLPNECSSTGLLREPRMDYEGGFDQTLLELADALSPAAFGHQFGDRG